MNNTFFFAALAALAVAFVHVMNRLAGAVRDEYREGHRRVGFAMIGMIVAIVAAALPWWML